LEKSGLRSLKRNLKRRSMTDKEDRKAKAKKTFKKILGYLGDAVVPILLAGLFKRKEKK
jgi:hypothetical protein